jgi:hypothetical protein
MNIRKIIKSQYHATLDMLRQVIVKCPDSLWASVESKNHFWRVAFHALFYTHLYLQPSEEVFVRWPKHRDESQFLGRLPWPPHDEPKIGQPYTKEELLEYLDFCREEVETKVDILELEGASGFNWQPFDKTELQFYNIRHLQQHVGELCERLGNQNIEVDWVGMAAPRK